MAHKTFISYKYSDIVEGKTNNLRDRIISAMGEDARFYNGERIDSPDMTGLRYPVWKAPLWKTCRAALFCTVWKRTR